MEDLYGFETGEAKRDNARTLHPTQPPFAFGSGGWWVLTFGKGENEMGLTLEFIAGDKARLVTAFQECDLDAFDDPAIAVAKADLSLHILPKDLNTLSLVLAKFNGQSPIDLRSHLTVLADEAGAGMLDVDDKWVAYAAAVPSGRAAEISEAWAERMRMEYNDPDTQATESMRASVEDLISLCKTASQGKLSVVHAWNG